MPDENPFYPNEFLTTGSAHGATDKDPPKKPLGFAPPSQIVIPPKRGVRK